MSFFIFCSHLFSSVFISGVSSQVADSVLPVPAGPAGAPPRFRCMALMRSSAVTNNASTVILKGPLQSLTFFVHLLNIVTTRRALSCQRWKLPGCSGQSHIAAVSHGCHHQTAVVALILVACLCHLEGQIEHATMQHFSFFGSSLTAEHLVGSRSDLKSIRVKNPSIVRLVLEGQRGGPNQMRSSDRKVPLCWFAELRMSAPADHQRSPVCSWVLLEPFNPVIVLHENISKQFLCISCNLEQKTTMLQTAFTVQQTYQYLQ